MVKILNWVGLVFLYIDKISMSEKLTMGAQTCVLQNLLKNMEKVYGSLNKILENVFSDIKKLLNEILVSKKKEA